MQFVVLNKSEKLNIDNNDLTLKDFSLKLQEEVNEFIDALEEKNKEHMFEEILDVIQVSINTVDKLVEEGMDLKVEINKHLKKLKKRKWQSKKLIIFQVFNWR